MIKIQTKLNNFSIFKEILHIFSNSNKDITIYGNGIIHEEINNCPKCGKSVTLNGYNTCTDKRAELFGLHFKKGKMICSNQDCDFSESTSQQVLKTWFSSFNEYIESIIISLKTKKLSSEDIADHLENTLKYTVSSESIRLKIKEFMLSINKPTPQEVSSGVIVHDEQFITIKGVEYKRISSVDANNKNVYYDELHTDRTEETITTICEKLRKDLQEFYAVVIDGHTASKNAFSKTFNNILIQFCLFHFSMNVREAYKEEVGYGQGCSCIPLEHLIGFFSIMNIFFDHEREIYELRVLQKELNNHIERINKSSYDFNKKQEYIDNYKRNYDKKARLYLKDIRKARRRKLGIKLSLRTEEQAKELLEKAKLENVFPKKVQKQIKRLEGNWVNFTHCLRDKKIPPTSNKVEQYYAISLNWIEKNNIQSIEHFLEQQKIEFIKRYNIEVFRQGIFSDFIRKTFILLEAFSQT